MPTGRAVFHVPVTIERAWAFLSSMEDVGSCVPGCQQVRVIDDRRSIWKVRADLGPFSRLLDMKAESVELLPPQHGRFVAVGRDLVTRGTIELEPLPERAETKVTYTVTADAQGFARALVNNAISLVIQDQAEQFARNVQAALSELRA